MLRQISRRVAISCSENSHRYLHKVSAIGTNKAGDTSTYVPLAIPEHLQQKKPVRRVQSIGGDPYSSDFRVRVLEQKMAKKARLQHPDYKLQLDRNKRLKTSHQPPSLLEGTHEEILDFEVAELLATSSNTSQNGAAVLAEDDALEDSDASTLPDPFSEIELEVLQVSSTGDGLALSASQRHVYVVPFSVTGDRVLARVQHPTKGKSYTHCDFIQLIRPSARRADVQPGCKYFATCTGCQFQMLPYQEQLEHKKTVVEKAYQRFSNLVSEQMPKVESTMGSPLQYGYRTKLTPHFDGPKKIEVSNGDGVKKERRFTSTPPIGFIASGKRRIMDIETCPISTPIIEAGLTIQRRVVKEKLDKYRKGATILLRESTERVQRSASVNGSADSDLPPEEWDYTDENNPRLIMRHPRYTDYKTYTTENNNTIKEYIGNYVYESVANSFFQNNNSILEPFLDHIRQHCLPSTQTQLSDSQTDPPIYYLLDAYCGSGLFAIGLSSLFRSVLGVEIDTANVEKARVNAKLNNVERAGFIHADAADLFAEVPYPPQQTLIVIDPPRRGASVDFLKQMCRYGPKRVVYVSCNVHTQARDVGMLVNGFEALGQLGKDEDVEGLWRYEIESLKGFDFFPQTGHVESVCILNRVPHKSS